MSLNLGWVDIALTCFLLLSTLLGLVRGFVFELLSLVGWFVAYFAALWATPYALPHVHVGAAGSHLNYGVTFACVFLVALVLWGLAARLVRALIRATPLSVVDRFLGAGFGLARGLVVLLLLTAVVGFSPWRHAPAWQQSQGAGWLQAMLEELRPLFTSDPSPYTTA